MIRSYSWTTGPAVGGNGVATAAASTPDAICGRILAVHVDYLNSPPAATTDFTLTSVADKVPGEGTLEAQTILTRTDTATAGWFYPRAAVDDSTGADALYAAGFPVREPFVVYSRLTATIAQADANDEAVVTVIVES